MGERYKQNKAVKEYVNVTQATKVITAHVPLLMADKVDQIAARLE
ncbi:hypothetical protein PJ077_20365, partial [Escherichia coli]|nr:hypothetical protein [Escherichia coli]